MSQIDDANKDKDKISINKNSSILNVSNINEVSANNIDENANNKSAIVLKNNSNMKSSMMGDNILDNSYIRLIL